MKTFFEKLKHTLYRYRHAWVFLYAFIYMPWFCWLEKTVTHQYYVISSPLDQYIPFNEIFIIPYLFWFVYVAATALYFFFANKQGFYKLAQLLIIGMTIFLIICTIFPNGLHLRPTTFARDNILVDLVKFVYSTDTPTNVCPSLHVYNSLACHIAISHDEKLRQNNWIKYGSLVTTILIILSTMFLKQHSVVDVVSAFIMMYFVYTFTYAPIKQNRPTFAHQIS